jgi:hypothetical protein
VVRGKSFANLPKGSWPHTVKTRNIRFGYLRQLFKPGKSSLSQGSPSWFRKPLRHRL